MKLIQETGHALGREHLTGEHQPNVQLTPLLDYEAGQRKSRLRFCKVDRADIDPVVIQTVRCSARIIEQNVEERIAAQTPLWLQLLHQFLKGHILVRVRLQSHLTYPS